MTKKNILSKINEWLRRYLPAEIVAIIGAMIGGLTTHYFFNNPVATALGGTWGGEYWLLWPNSLYRYQS